MKEKVIEIIQNACAIDEEVTPESELKLLSLDSLSFVEAIVEIENYFGIDCDDGILMNEYLTVNDLIDYVRRKINEKQELQVGCCESLQ